TELRSVRLTEDDETRPLVATDELAVVARNQRLADGRAVREPSSRVSREQVLQQERYAAKRSFRELAERGSPRLLVHRRDDRVQLAVHPLEASDRRIQDLDRLDVSLSHPLGGRERVFPFGRPGHRSSLCRAHGKAKGAWIPHPRPLLDRTA